MSPQGARSKSASIFHFLVVHLSLRSCFLYLCAQYYPGRTTVTPHPSCDCWLPPLPFLHQGPAFELLLLATCLNGSDFGYRYFTFCG
ncbi:hypothetical protein BJY52DRAFT_121831 [Lactarius psammicola]|nr:hypothetical protein BJY52DRAFT_121831 [Lactarius psammicola]